MGGGAWGQVEVHGRPVSLTESESRFARWKKAVQRCMDWETTETSADTQSKILIFRFRE